MGKEQILEDFKRTIEKNEVRGETSVKVMGWANSRMTDAAIMLNVCGGFMECVGWDEESKSPLFKLTDKGSAAAEKLMGN